MAGSEDEWKVLCVVRGYHVYNDVWDLYLEDDFMTRGVGNNYFSGFSVGSCINEEKVVCYQLELGKNLADISSECSSHH